MALTNEDLKAIAELMDERIKPLKDDIRDLKSDIHNLSDMIEVLEIKQDVTSHKLEDLTFREASMEHSNKKEFTKINDQLETLTAVLEAKNILPKQA
ncbi:hypothetical protein [Clostridium sp. Marseille-P2415]|uniref:hypothetical protein n=1 Tax=Clostridium sp. Marseille-P2415 TaxID=1805471 RepID=UPI0009886CC0|nr:hypothetical protein [Clostridium sp. Marseille-P2415]